MKKLSTLDVGSNSIVAIPQSLSKLMLLNSFNISAVPLYPAEANAKFEYSTIISFNEFVTFGRKHFFPSFENKSSAEIEALIAENCGIQNFSKIILDEPRDVQKINIFISNECQRLESAASLKDDKAGHGLPSELFMLKRLENLNLSYQNIMQIPSEINRLRRLKRLVLHCCTYLREVSEQLGSIESIECKLRYTV